MKTELLHTFVADPRSVPAVDRLPDGTIVTGGGDGHLRRWDPAHWIELSSVDAHGRGVRALRVTGGRIASVGGDRSLRVWSAVQGRPLYTVARRVSGQLGGGYLVGNSSRGRICVHDAESGELIRRLPRLDDDIRCFTIVGDAAVAGAADGLVRLPLAGGRTHRWARTAPVLAIDGDADGVCAVTEDARIGAWSNGGECAWQTDADGALPQAIRISPDGERVAVSMAYQVRILDRRSGRASGTIKSRLKGLFGLAWSADGGRLYCGAADGRVRVWSVER